GRVLVPLVGDEQVELPPAVAEDVAGEREAAGLSRRLEERLATRLGLLPASELVQSIESPDERRPVRTPVLRAFEPGRDLEQLAAAAPGLIDRVVVLAPDVLKSCLGAIKQRAGDPA